MALNLAKAQKHGFMAKTKIAKPNAMLHNGLFLLGKTMTDFLPPPPELVRQWMTEFYGTPIVPGEACTDLAARAAQWSADQELEACCHYFARDLRESLALELRVARRPKPQTLNSIALQMLGTIERDAHYLPEITDTIRRALEQLDD
jgi:hypothetical protein